MRERRTGLAEHAEVDAADRIRQPVGTGWRLKPTASSIAISKRRRASQGTMIWLGLMGDIKMFTDSCPKQVSVPLESTLTH